MPNRRNLSRLAVVSLLVAAVSAPAASAMPADPVTTTDPATAPAYPTPTAKSEKSAAQQNMHASTVHKPVPTGQDVRGEYAKDPSIAPQTKAPVVVDTKPLPGPPVFPTTTDVLSPPKETVTTTDGDGGDIEWPVAAISLAAAMLIGGGLGAAAHRMRASARPAH
jgi:hypothetical protein